MASIWYIQTIPKVQHSSWSIWLEPQLVWLENWTTEIALKGDHWFSVGHHQRFTIEHQHRAITMITIGESSSENDQTTRIDEKPKHNEENFRLWILRMAVAMRHQRDPKTAFHETPKTHQKASRQFAGINTLKLEIGIKICPLYYLAFRHDQSSRPCHNKD